MSESGRIWDLLQRSFEGGEAWHCPSLRDLLGSVTAEQAAARPIAGAPTVFELLLHLTAFQDLVSRRLEREAATTPAAWRAALVGFEEAHRRLRQSVAAFPDERLKQAVPGREYPFYVMLYGAIEHALYHAGQIEMLMVAQGVRPQGSPMPARVG